MAKHNAKRKLVYDKEWINYLAPVLQKIQNQNSVNFQTLHNFFYEKENVFTFCQQGDAFKKGTGEFNYILDLHQKENNKHPVRQSLVAPFALGCCVDPANPLQ